MYPLSAAHSASVASGLQLKSARDDVLLLHCDEAYAPGVLPFPQFPPRLLELSADAFS